MILVPAFSLTMMADFALTRRGMLKTKFPIKAITLFIIILFLPLQARSQYFSDQGYDPSQALDSFFGQSCPLTRGNYNNEAMAQNQSISGIIASIKSDPKCQGIRGTLIELDNLRAQVLLRPQESGKRMEMLRSEIFQIEGAILEEQKRLKKTETVEPLNLLPLENSESYLRTLMALLAEKRVQLIENQNNADFFRYDNKLSTFDNVANYTDSLFLALENQEDCFTGGTNTVAQVASQLLTLSSTVMSGYSGAALYASGKIMDNFVRYLRKRTWANLEKEAFYGRMGIALPCALEAMTRSYCESKNLSNLALFFGSQVGKPKKIPNLLLDSIELLTVASDPYLRWVTRLDAGSEPTSSSASQRKTGARQLRFAFDSFGDAASGIIGEAISKTLISPSTEVQTRTSSFNSLLNLVSSNMFGNNGQPAIFRDIFSQDFDCGPRFYMYTGYRENVVKTCVNRQPNENCNDCLLRTTQIDPNVIPTLEQQRASIDRLKQEAQVYLDLEISTSQENNPVLVLNQVDQSQNSFASPIQFIESAIKILRQFLTVEPFISNPRAMASIKMQLLLLEESLILLNTRLEFTQGSSEVLSGPRNNDLRKIIGLKEDFTQEQKGEENPFPEEPPQGPTPLPDTSEDPFKKAQYIVNTLARNLARGQDIFYTTKPLYAFVDQYLLYQVTTGKLPADIALTLRLNFQDRLGTFLPMFSNLETIKSQTQNAQQLIHSNIEVFGKAFAEGTNNFKVVMAKEFFNDNAGSNEDDRLTLKCLLFLSLPESVVSTSWLNGYCRNKAYYSVYYDQSGLMLDYNTLASRRGERTATYCAAYDFLRKSKFWSMAAMGKERDKLFKFKVRTTSFRGEAQEPNPRDGRVSSKESRPKAKINPAKIFPWNWKKKPSSTENTRN